MASLLAVAAPEQSQDSQLTTEGARSILDSGDYQLIKSLAKSYYANPTDNQALLDVFANFLLGNQHRSDKVQVDALAWLCRALGASENGRYYTVLLDISRHGGSRKLRKYASVSLRKVGYASDIQYLDIYRQNNP